MITGRFGDTSGRPFVEGRLFLPRLGISGDVSFLLDTGADSSILMPGDARRLGVDFSRLSGSRDCVGIGGIASCFVEPALMVFNDPGVALYVYELDLDIMRDDPNIQDVHSLLGRDVLDQWRILYDPCHPKSPVLRITIRKAKHIINLRSAKPE
jgi:predicted aspartyl protease